jgi:hypothetical protein
MVAGRVSLKGAADGNSGGATVTLKSATPDETKGVGQVSAKLTTESEKKGDGLSTLNSQLLLLATALRW